jgi:hypothetical protein
MAAILRTALIDLALTNPEAKARPIAAAGDVICVY